MSGVVTVGIVVGWMVSVVDIGVCTVVVILHYDCMFVCCVIMVSILVVLVLWVSTILV